MNNLKQSIDKFGKANDKIGIAKATFMKQEFLVNE